MKAAKKDSDMFKFLDQKNNNQKTKDEKKFFASLGTDQKKESNKTKTPIESHHIHISLSLIVIIILGIVIAMLIGPAWNNYATQKELDELGQNAQQIVQTASSMKIENELLKNNITALTTATDDLLSKNAELSQKITSYEQRIEQLKNDVESVKEETEKTITELKNEHGQEVDEVKSSLTQAEEDFEQLRTSAARSICCKQRVDDSSIDSYNVDDNRIECSEGGEYSLTC